MRTKNQEFANEVNRVIAEKHPDYKDLTDEREDDLAEEMARLMQSPQVRSEE